MLIRNRMAGKKVKSTLTDLLWYSPVIPGKCGDNTASVCHSYFHLLDILVLVSLYSYSHLIRHFVLTQKQMKTDWDGFYKCLSFKWSPFVSLLSRCAQYGRWSSFGKRVRFTESHIVLIISFLLVVLFTQFILDIK